MPQIGTNGNDPESYFNNTDPVIYALDGDDFIRYTGLANAYIEGGRGNDTVYTGAGKHVVYGGDGNDFLYMGAGAHTVYGGDGDDFIQGHQEGYWFQLSGQIGNVIYGGNGNDVIYAGGGRTHIYGDEGNDTIYGNIIETDASRLDGGGGDDIIFGGGGKDTRVYGGDGDDMIYGQSALYLFGGTGNDSYEVTRADQMVLETSNDLIPSGVRYPFFLGEIDKVYAYVDFTLPDYVEHLIMTYGAQTYGYGNDLNNSIYGNAQGNVIEGRGGYDTLIGGGGSDLFVVNPNWGVDVVTDFVAGAGTQDAVIFSRSIFADYEQVIANARQVGADTWIESGPDNVVVLQNVALGSLHQDDFGFV